MGALPSKVRAIFERPETAPAWQIAFVFGIYIALLAALIDHDEFDVAHRQDAFALLLSLLRFGTCPVAIACGCAAFIAAKNRVQDALGLSLLRVITGFLLAGILDFTLR